MFTQHKKIILIIAFFIQMQLFCFTLQNGDILFQETNPNDFSDAIIGVTTSVTGYNFSHCGIFYIDTNGLPWVIESLPDKGVVLTPIDTFFLRHLTIDNQPKVAVGRLINTH